MVGYEKCLKISVHKSMQARLKVFVSTAKVASIECHLRLSKIID